MRKKLMPCIVALSCYCLTAQTQSLPQFSAKIDCHNTLPFDKGKVMNVARGGHTTNFDLTWMPAFYNDLAKVGISHFRVDWILSEWFYGAVKRDSNGELTYDFTSLDKVLCPMLKKGITPIMCVTQMPSALASQDNKLPDSWDDYRAVLRQLVGHYKSLGYAGLVWESHNEPETFQFSAAECYEMYKVFATTIKEADPTAIVGGYGAVGRDWINYIRTFLDCYKNDDAHTPMDFFSYHQYGHDDWTDEMLIENTFTNRGLDVPDIYVDEWNDDWTKGGTVGNCFDTNLNAVYIAKKMFMSYQYPHIKKICLFNFADTNTDKIFSGDIGAWTVGGRRKAAANVFDFYGQLYDQLVTPSVSGSETSDYNRYVFFTKENGNSLAGIAWNKTDADAVAAISFEGLDGLDEGEYFLIEKSLIDATHGNLYHDYLNGNFSKPENCSEKAPVVKTWNCRDGNVGIADTLTENSVAFYRLSKKRSDDIGKIVPTEYVYYDITSTVGTSQKDWNAGGVCAIKYAPAVTTADGRNVEMMETYAANISWTTTPLSQMLTGLDNGLYEVVIYANACYTPDRGFSSDIVEGATDVAYVFANDVREYLPSHIATSLSVNGEYTLRTIVIDGTLQLGLGMDRKGTNWHTIQIKSLKRLIPAGDINSDGRITIADVTALVNILLGKPDKGYNLLAADLTGDGKTTIADVTRLVNIILGK